MLRYVLKRLLLAIPTLLLISLFTFGLSKCAHYDPVTAILGDDLSSGLDPEAQGRTYERKAAQLKLDMPDFYCTVSSAIFPDTLFKIYPPERRERLIKLTAWSANWPAVADYETTLAKAVRAVNRLPDTLAKKSDLNAKLHDLLYQSDPVAAQKDIGESRQILAGVAVGTAAATTFDSLDACVRPLCQYAGTIRRWIPVVYWNGTRNQYHKWLTGFVTGDLGSSIGGRSVVQELRPRLFSTLTVNGFAILLALLLSIPLGVYLARFESTPFDKSGRGLLLFLYSIPIFWLGGLLMMTFATPGQGLHLISSIYTDPWNSRTSTFLHYFARNAVKFILPVCTLSIHLLAILTLQMRSGMLNILHEDYIRTARAKGLTENRVFWRHGFRNALFPLITIFAGLIPAAFAGSIVVEVLFQFPGIGMKTQEAFVSRDYPVLFAILMLMAALTILGQLIGDLLYAWADPRVRFTRK